MRVIVRVPRDPEISEQCSHPTNSDVNAGSYAGTGNTTSESKMRSRGGVHQPASFQSRPRSVIAGNLEYLWGNSETIRFQAAGTNHPHKGFRLATEYRISMGYMTTKRAAFPPFHLILNCILLSKDTAIAPIQNDVVGSQPPQIQAVQLLSLVLLGPRSHCCPSQRHQPGICFYSFGQGGAKFK